MPAPSSSPSCGGSSKSRQRKQPQRSSSSPRRSRSNSRRKSEAKRKTKVRRAASPLAGEDRDKSEARRTDKQKVRSASVSPAKGVRDANGCAKTASEKRRKRRGGSRSQSGSGQSKRETSAEATSSRVARGRGRQMYKRRASSNEDQKKGSKQKGLDEKAKAKDQASCEGEEAKTVNKAEAPNDFKERSKGRSGSSRSSRDSKASKGKRPRRRRRRRRGAGRSRSRSRGRRARSRARRSRRSRSRSRGEDIKERDKRPAIEKVKGGVKLFVGRLPLEATQQMLKEAFEEFGEVLEVFLIDPARGTTGARCAFVRIGSLKNAEEAIEKMHEKRVLVPERRELGPIQVAFAKGEAVRFGLDCTKETLPSRWQVPQPGNKELGGPSATLDPETLSKDDLTYLVKEGQRQGGQPFKAHWWSYCDGGKGGVTDHDPMRHSKSSLRKFFATTLQSDLGNKPWFRRVLQWSVLGGRTSGRHRRALGGRGKRRGESGSSRSYSSSSSRSSSSSQDQNAEGKSVSAPHNDDGIGTVVPLPQLAAQQASTGVKMPFPQLTTDSVRPVTSTQPPLPDGPPPPDPAAFAKARMLGSAAERNLELETFLAKHRISPSTSFLMLKLTREQASAIMSSVNDQLASSLPTTSSREAEEIALAKIKSLGIRPSGVGGGSWTSTERTGSPARSPVVAKLSMSSSANSAGASLFVGRPAALREDTADALPSVDSLLGPGIPSLSKVVEVLDDVETCTKPQKVELCNKPGAFAQMGSSIRLSVQDEPALTADSVGGDTTNRPKNVSKGGARVFVKNIDKTTAERDLRDLFGKFGEVVEVQVPKDKESGLGRGFAYLTFSTSEAATASVQALHFTKPWGRALIVEWLRAPGEVDGPEPERSGRTAQEDVKKGGETDSRERQGVDDKKLTRPEASRNKAPARNASASSKSSAGKKSDSSGWSRYTVTRGERKTRRVREKSHQKSRRRLRRRSSSRTSSYSSYSNGSSGSSERRYRQQQEEELLAHAAAAGLIPPVMDGWPPPGPTAFMPPGMMPPPWAMPPPWGIPRQMFDEPGFPSCDRKGAERPVQKPEKHTGKRESDREKGASVREDHQARIAHLKRSASQRRSPSRIPQRVPSSSSSSSSRSKRVSRGRGKRSQSRRRIDSRSRRSRSSRSPGRSDMRPLPPPPPGMPLGMHHWHPGGPSPFGMPPPPPGLTMSCGCVTPGMMPGMMHMPSMMLPPGPPHGMLTVPHGGTRQHHQQFHQQQQQQQWARQQEQQQQRTPSDAVSTAKVSTEKHIVRARHVVSDDSDVDSDKVEEEINFADI